MLLALLVGAALGAGGAVVQSLSRNPLGSPDIIGVNAGAAAGAVLMILVLGSETGQGVSLGALACGLAAGLLVYALSFRRGVKGTRLVLVGVGVTAMLHSLIAYLLTRADLYESQGAKVWLIGSLAGANWDRVWPVALAVAAGLPVALGLSRSAALMEMGDAAAGALGLRVERLRLVLLLVAVGCPGWRCPARGPSGSWRWRPRSSPGASPGRPVPGSARRPPWGPCCWRPPTWWPSGCPRPASFPWEC